VAAALGLSANLRPVFVADVLVDLDRLPLPGKSMPILTILLASGDPVLIARVHIDVVA
jgi:hypothetical protein